MNDQESKREQDAWDEMAKVAEAYVKSLLLGKKANPVIQAEAAKELRLAAAKFKGVHTGRFEAEFSKAPVEV